MKYRDLVRLTRKHPKGTSRKKRRQIDLMLDAYALENSAELLDATRQAAIDSALFGVSATHVSWSEERAEVRALKVEDFFK